MNDALRKLRDCAVYFNSDDCVGSLVVQEVVKEFEKLTAEVARLRADVTRLQMTPEETATIQSLSRAGVIGVRKLLARHAEIKGERANDV